MEISIAPLKLEESYEYQKPLANSYAKSYILYIHLNISAISHLMHVTSQLCISLTNLHT